MNSLVNNIKFLVRKNLFTRTVLNRTTSRVQYPEPKQDPIEDKVVLISGGCDEIGIQVAKALLEHGIRSLVMADNDEKKGRSAIEKLSEDTNNDNISFIATSKSDTSWIRNAFESTMCHCDGLDIVINNIKFDQSDWGDQIDSYIKNSVAVNLLGMEYMGKQNCHNGGVIVNIINKVKSDYELYPIDKGIKKFLITFNNLIASIYYDCTSVRIITMYPNFASTNYSDKIGKELVNAITNGQNGSIWVL